MLRKYVWMLGLLVMGGLIGCGATVPPEVVPALEPVSGKVTIDGKPSAGVAVTFFPAPNNKGTSSSATTDDSGAYTLKYRTGDDGVAAGDYIVMFTKLTQPDGTPIPEGKTAADVNAVDQIPARYRTTDQPVNTVTVPPGGKTFDFDIKSK